jgi:hypothetical protein
MRKIVQPSPFSGRECSPVNEFCSRRCTYAIGQSDQVDSSPFSGIVQETHEVFSIDYRQFTVDDNKLIRYVSQNRERVFSLRYPVHDPTFVLEVLHNGFAKSAIVRDNESSAKVWQLHWNDGDCGSGVIALADQHGNQIRPFLCREPHFCGVSLRSGTSISPSVFLMGCLLRNLVRVQTSGPISAERICDMPEVASSRTTCTMAPSIR